MASMAALVSHSRQTLLAALWPGNLRRRTASKGVSSSNNPKG
jgi:hypothetical protein